MILRSPPCPRGRRARAPLLSVLVSAGVLAASSPGCRSPVPDEHVYTGRGQSPGESTGGRTNAQSGANGLGSSPSGGSSSGGRAESGGGSSAGAGADSAAGAGTDGLGGDAGGSNVPDVTPITFSKAALLAAVADCTLAELRSFVTLAAALRDRALNQVEARTDENVGAARRAFRDAMAAWQQLEVHRFGPAARKSDDPIGGQDLRDEIYAWPLGGRCNIETQLVSEGYAQPDFSTQLINVRGLGTLEYLLFNDDADNGCPNYSPLNAQGTWAALGLEQIRARKAEYARVVADDVLAHAQALLSAWEQGKFREQLSEAGTASSHYPSQQAALNAVSNAIFYVEREVKDKKLALPLGISPECTSGLCPEALESQYAGLSTDNIQQNLLGFQRLFWGCGRRASGLGFDDWLHEVGAGELAQRMRLAFDSAKTAVDELDPPLEQAIISRPDAARAVYDRLKELTFLLKTEFVSALQLELPTGSETDND